MTEKQRKAFACHDCGKDTLISNIDYYMVDDFVWKVHAKMKSGMLCMDCLQKRLKRKLKFNDLTLCEVNITNNYTREIIKKHIYDYEKSLINDYDKLLENERIRKRAIGTRRKKKKKNL